MADNAVGDAIVAAAVAGLAVDAAVADNHSGPFVNHWNVCKLAADIDTNDGIDATVTVPARNTAAYTNPYGALMLVTFTGLANVCVIAVAEAEPVELDAD